METDNLTPDDQGQQLTPSARAALDEYLLDYRRSVLRTADSVARRRGLTHHEISVSDVVEAIDAGGQSERSNRQFAYRESALTRLLRIYAVGGLVMIVGSVIYYIVTTAELSPASRTATLIGSTGAVLSAVSAGALYRRSALRVVSLGSIEMASSIDQTSELLRLWAKFEVVSRSSLASEVGETTASTLNLSEMLRRMIDLGMISGAESETLRRLLKQRNRIVHEGADFNSPNGADDLREVRRIIARLSR